MRRRDFEEQVSAYLIMAMRRALHKWADCMDFD
jgi:hypothetical protein